MVVVGGELFEDLERGRGGGDGRRRGEAEGVDCRDRGGVEFGVDADGVGEGERRDGCEVADDEGGDVWEVDGICFEGLKSVLVSGYC